MVTNVIQCYTQVDEARTRLN